MIGRSSLYNPNSIFQVQENKDGLNSSDVNDEDGDSLDNIDIHTLSEQKRSQLQKSECVTWLRRRFQNKAKKQYLYYPDELLKHIEIKNIFKSFDKDHSSTKTFLSFVGKIIIFFV
jgi:hypothetical protein